MEFNHVPVMLEECLYWLCLKDNAIYVDATIGGAGHSIEILKRTKNTNLVGIDQDLDALSASAERLKEFSDRVTLVHANFSDLDNILDKAQIKQVDGVLIDLGVSSFQLDTASRGFSFRFDAPLDMRMNQEQNFSAFDVVNSYSENDLKKLMSDYGEERFASRIAKNIIIARNNAPIKTTFDLKNLIISSVPKARGLSPMDSVQRVFQAIRIEVNGELKVIEKTLNSAIAHLKPGGRIVVLTFHSLEDRIVKQTFKSLSTNCICPPEIPICVCGGNNAKIRLINNKPIIATKEEITNNSRSASAKLRVAERI